MIRFMQRGTALAAIVLPSIALAQASPGESTTYLIRGGTVITETGAKLPNTNILVRNGRITQMGANVTANDAKVVDATGMPFVDLLPDVENMDPSTLWVTVPDPHPNGKADTAFADAMVKTLLPMLDELCRTQQKGCPK